MILPISSWDDGRVSFLFSRFWGSVFLVLRLFSLVFVPLFFCLSLMILPMGSALALVFSLVGSLLGFSLPDFVGAGLADADLAAGALGAGLALGAAWAILHAKSRARAVVRRSR